MLDAAGQQFGTFEATLNTDGTGGTFVMGDGDSGTWGYDAPTGRELRKLMGLADEVPAETVPAAETGDSQAAAG